MEEETTNKLFFQFKIDVPNTIEQSNFNTLILRIVRLKTSIEETKYIEEEYKEHNKNVEEIQKLLEDFKYRIYNKENNQ